MSTWQLIEAVQRFPVLFDASHCDYHDAAKKDDVWNAVAAELGSNNSGEEVKRRWKNVRDTYTNFLRSCKGKAGQSADNKTWVWAKQMEPFQPFLSPETNVSAPLPDAPPASADSKDGGPAPVPADLYEEGTKESGSCSSWLKREGENSGCETPGVAAQTTPRQSPLQEENVEDCAPRSGKLRTWRVSTESSASVRDVVACLETMRTEKEMHEVDGLFSAYAKTVKTFSRRRQALVKLKMANLMAEQEFLHLDEVDAMTANINNGAAQ